MTAKMRVSAVSAALVIVCAGFLVIHPAADPLPVPLQPLPLVTVAWVLFVAAAWLLRGVPLRSAVALIIIGAVAIQVVAVSGRRSPAPTSTGTCGTAGCRRTATTRTPTSRWRRSWRAFAIRSCPTTTRWRGLRGGGCPRAGLAPA